MIIKYTHSLSSSSHQKQYIIHHNEVVAAEEEKHTNHLFHNTGPTNCDDVISNNVFGIPKYIITNNIITINH